MPLLVGLCSITFVALLLVVFIGTIGFIVDMILIVAGFDCTCGPAALPLFDNC